MLFTDFSIFLFAIFMLCDKNRKYSYAILAGSKVLVSAIDYFV